MKKLLIYVMMAFLMPTASMAQNTAKDWLKKGQDHYQKYEFKEAFQWCMKAAEKGLAEAQYLVSKMYENGDGVEEDEKLAFQWCRKAAENGYAKAQFTLGEYYDEGVGVRSNSKEAFQWYLKGALAGNKNAQEEAEDLIEDMPKEIQQKAFEQILAAAKNGSEWAQLTASECYEEGIGTEENEKQAAYWYEEYTKTHASKGSKTQLKKTKKQSIKEYQEAFEKSQKQSKRKD